MIAATVTFAIAIYLFWYGVIYLAPFMFLAAMTLLMLPYLIVKDWRHRRAVNRRAGRKIL